MDTPDENAAARTGPLDYVRLATEMLAGSPLRSVRKDNMWFFRFADHIEITTWGPWRLITTQGVVVTSDDHGHPFGLPDPVDAAEHVRSVACGRSVTEVALDPTTGDLTIRFGGEAWLQFLQMSCGYEAWQLRAGGAVLLCMGGGGVVYFPAPVQT